MSDIRWHLGRLAGLSRGALRHLHREGFGRTLQRSARQLREALVVGPTDPVERHNEGRPRLLVIDAQMPDPTRDSGSVRMLHLLQILHELGWTVDFMPDGLHARAADKAVVEATGAHVLCRPAMRSLAAWLRRHGPALDAVMLCRCHVAHAHLQLARKYAPSARILFDTVDLHHLREMRAAELNGNPRLLRQARRTRRQELNLIRHCDVTFVVSPLEQKWLRKDLPQADIRLLSNIHPAHPPGPVFESRQGLLFIGGWDHPPNRDAIHWLVDKIAPQLGERMPGITLHLVGTMPEAIRTHLQRPGIHIHGRIADIEPLLRQCRLSLAPLRYGAGVKGKVNTAMSYGLPVIATSSAIEGMFLTDGRDVLVADTAEAFVDAIVRAYHDFELWTALATGGQNNIRQHFSFEAARQTLASALPNTVR